MLDEPTRGVDVGAKAEIYRLLFEAAERGIGDPRRPRPRSRSSSRSATAIVVMFRGRIAATLSRSDATEARIAYFAGGHQ